jgi:hypothetical protein
MTISCDGIHREATSKVTRAAQVSEGAKNSARYWADARYGAPTQFTLDQFKGDSALGRREYHLLQFVFNIRPDMFVPDLRPNILRT